MAMVMEMEVRKRNCSNRINQGKYNVLRILSDNGSSGMNKG